MNGNKIICYMGTDQVTFTVTKNDIKYSVKNIDNENVLERLKEEVLDLTHKYPIY